MDNDEVHTEEDTGSAAESDAVGGASGDGTVAPKAVDGAPGPSSTELIRRLNAATPGELVLHFARRDMAVQMTGAAAVRVMAAHLRARSDGLDDDLHPDRSLMMDSWVTIDFEKLMEITWVPGVVAEDVILAALSEPAS